MNPSEDDLTEVNDRLSKYKRKVEDEKTFDKVEDALEIDVNGGRIWVHPQSGDLRVKIHFVNDTGKDSNFDGTGVVISHLVRHLGFPDFGEYEPHNTYFSNRRRTYEVNFEYFVSDET